MQNPMQCLTYIYHDCFVYCDGAVQIVFDYWLDAGGEEADFPAFLEGLDPSRPLYVFVSHSHKDHYNPVIFGWAERFSHIRYIVSKDVWRRMRHIVSPTSVYSGPKIPAELVSVLRPGERYKDNLLTVVATPSTDTGNSYVIQTADCRLFHAGDLNLWAWSDRMTPQEYRKALGDYNACLRDIRSALDSLQSSTADTISAQSAFDFNHAMFPIDPRLGQDKENGADLFRAAFRIEHFHPMHYCI